MHPWSSTVQRQSCLVYRQSYEMHHQSCVVHRQSSAMQRMSCPVHRQSSAMQRQSCLVYHQSSAIQRQSSAMQYQSCLVHCQSCLKKGLENENNPLTIASIIHNIKLNIDFWCHVKPCINLKHVNVLFVLDNKNPKYQKISFLHRGKFTKHYVISKSALSTRVILF